MSVCVHSNDFSDYFNYVVCMVKANDLHTYSSAVALRHTSTIFNEHLHDYHCF